MQQFLYDEYTKRREELIKKKQTLENLCNFLPACASACACVCVYVNHSCHIPNPAGVIKWEESGMKEEEGGVRGEMGCF